MPNFTSETQIPHAISAWYDKNLLVRAVPLLVHTMYGQVRDLPRNNSNFIKFRKFGSLSAATTPLTPGVTPAGSQLSSTDILVELKQYGDYVEITDFFDMTTIDNVLLEAGRVLGEQAGETLDVIARDVLNLGTNVYYVDATDPAVNAARGDIVAADVPTYADILAVVKILANANAKPVTSFVNPDTGYDTTPLAPSYIGIVDPSTAMILKQITQFVPVEKYANKADVMPGELGKIDRVRFIETTQAKVFAGEGNGGIDVHSTVILGQNAYGTSRISGEAMKTIVKTFGSGGAEDPLNQRATKGWKATFAAAILQQLFMVRMEHAA